MAVLLAQMIKNDLHQYLFQSRPKLRNILVTESASR